MSRQIIHVDMDAYYASVEQLLRPSFYGQPVVVAGGSKRSVVSAASYEARKYGIHSAMPIEKARRLCGDLIILPVRMAIYRAYSIRIMEILNRYTPSVETIALDEAFMDITESTAIFGDPARIVVQIKHDIEKETGLSCSIGLAPNKLLAKLASEQGKPGGITIVNDAAVDEFLDNMPVRAIPGIGQKMSTKLKDLGINTVGQLRELDEASLARRFGATGKQLWQLARGIDISPVMAARQRKSLGHEITFEEDLYTTDKLISALAELSSHVGTALRDRGLFCSVVRLKFRYRDFTTVTRQTRLPIAANCDEEIYKTASKLLIKNCQPGLGIRLIGITCTQLGPIRQMDIADQSVKKENLYRGIDKIRSRYGIPSIMPGTTLLQRQNLASSGKKRSDKAR